MSRAATRNRLLASLPDADLKRWSPSLRAVRLAQGQVLHELGERPGHVYFPTTAIVSLLYKASPSLSAEVGMIGNEGMVGLPLLTGDDAEPLGRAVVQSTGWAFQLSASALRDDRERGLLMQLLLWHTQALVTQIAQIAACIRHHSVTQQMCRWLLLCLDRVDTDDLSATQAVIAAKLGVRRAGVNECARRLQEGGLIRCSRGRISILNRVGLEQQACGCYEVIRKEYRRLKLDPRARVSEAP
jgi:CRP-like cAMP-binding protein